MKTKAFKFLVLLGILASFGCQKEKAGKTVEESKIDTSIYLFREMLEPSKNRTISLKSDEPIQIWVGVEYDETDIKKVPDGGYMSALLTNTDSFRSVSGTAAATTFYPKEGIINLEVKNESDVALVTVVSLREENVSIYKKYNESGDDNSE